MPTQTVQPSTEGSAAATQVSDAQTEDTGVATADTMRAVPFVLMMFVAMTAFVVLAGRKKKEEAQLRNSLEIGDEITTIGGIMGRVVAIKDDEDAIIIETGSDRVKMKFKKWCISTVDTVKEQSQQAGQPEKKGFFGFGKKKDSDETKATKE